MYVLVLVQYVCCGDMMLHACMCCVLYATTCVYTESQCMGCVPSTTRPFHGSVFTFTLPPPNPSYPIIVKGNVKQLVRINVNGIIVLGFLRGWAHKPPDWQVVQKQLVPIVPPDRMLEYLDIVVCEQQRAHLSLGRVHCVRVSGRGVAYIVMQGVVYIPTRGWMVLCTTNNKRVSWVYCGTYHAPPACTSTPNYPHIQYIHRNLMSS